MGIEQTLITWIHLIASAIWVGGSIFLGVVLAPILKTMYTSHEERIQIMIRVGRRFNKLAVPSLLILIGTGIYNSRHVLNDSEFLFSTDYGMYLIIKILLVVSLIIVFLIHVRIIRKDVEDKIMSKQMSQQQLQKLRKKIIILGEVTVVISIAILFFAAVLDSGL